MLKKSPSRGQRTKGVKLKHVLQIGLLLGICFWLIYQVKHSQDKRKEHDGRVTEILIKEESSNLIRFGRKDLNPRLEKAKNEKPEEEEDDEEEEIRNQEEDNKHLTAVQKEEKIKHDLHKEEDDEETKNGDSEDEGRGGGDDEIDERDQDTNEGEIDHDEEFMNEEKEREEEENEKEADEIENEEGEVQNESVQNQDSGGDSKSTHEAREEHYKADDASSEVAQDTQTETNDLGKLSVNNSDKEVERTVLAQNDTSNNAAVSLKQKESNSEAEEGASGKNDGSISLRNDKTHKVSLSSSLNSSLANLTIENHLNDQPDASNKSEQVNPEATSNSTHMTTSFSRPNLTENPLSVIPAEKAIPDSPKTGQAPKLVSGNPDLTNNVNTSSDSNQGNFNFTSTETKIAEATAMYTWNSSTNAESTLSEKIVDFNLTAKVRDGSRPTPLKGDGDTTLREVSSNNVDPVRTNKSTVSSYPNKSEDAIQHNLHNSLDSSKLEDGKEVRTWLGTLPEAEGNNNPEVDAE